MTQNVQKWTQCFELPDVFYRFLRLTPEPAPWPEMNEAFLEQSALWRLVCKQFVQNM